MSKLVTTIRNYQQQPHANNNYLSTATTLNPAQAILVLKPPLNKDHLSTTTSDHSNMDKIEI